MEAQHRRESGVVVETIIRNRIWGRERQLPGVLKSQSESHLHEGCYDRPLLETSRH